VAEDVVAAFAGLATRKDISLRREDRGAPPVVTDPERLRRILENLVDNAVKYTPGGGSVAITTSAGPDGSARIEVADNGPGIAAEHQARIFERFYRVDKARSRELGAPAWDSRSSGTWPRAWAPRCRWRASRGGGRGSR